MLLAKTAENGATEAEDVECARKGAGDDGNDELTDKELSLTKEEKAIIADDDDASDPHSIKWRLAPGIRQFCNCESGAARASRAAGFSFAA